MSWVTGNVGTEKQADSEEVKSVCIGIIPTDANIYWGKFLLRSAIGHGHGRGLSLFSTPSACGT